MGWPQDDLDEPWRDDPPPERRSPAPSGEPTPAAREGLADGDNWGIPGLELTATVRAGKAGERSAEKERALAEARKRVVNAILPEVLDKAEALRQRIWQEYEKAVKEGRGATDADKTVRAVQLLARARRMRDRLMADLQAKLSERAAEVEAEAIPQEADRKPEILAPMVGEALTKALKALSVVMRLHPRDFKRLQDHELDLVIELEQCPDIDLRADEWIRPGACVIETEAGAIEAHPDTQPESLARLLLEPPAVR
jgi:flagellar assembly protein FliH